MFTRIKMSRMQKKFSRPSHFSPISLHFRYFHPKNSIFWMMIPAEGHGILETPAMGCAMPFELVYRKTSQPALLVEASFLDRIARGSSRGPKLSVAGKTEDRSATLPSSVRDRRRKQMAVGPSSREAARVPAPLVESASEPSPPICRALSSKSVAC